MYQLSKQEKKSDILIHQFQNLLKKFNNDQKKQQFQTLLQNYQLDENLKKLSMLCFAVNQASASAFLTVCQNKIRIMRNNKITVNLITDLMMHLLTDLTTEQIIR